MKFQIELHRHGVLRDNFAVGAAKAYVAGVWCGDWAYLPRFEHVRAGLPYRYRRAFERNPIWWSANCSDVVRCDLHYSKSGAPLGTILARFEP